MRKEEVLEAALCGKLKSAGRANFGDELQEKYKEKVGLDPEKADIEELLSEHRDASPLIDGKSGAFLMSFTHDRKVAERFGDYILKTEIPDEKIASSPEEMDEDKIFAAYLADDFEKEVTCLKPEIPSRYILSVEDRDGNPLYFNSKYNPNN